MDVSAKSAPELSIMTVVKHLVGLSWLHLFQGSEGTSQI